MRVAYLDCFAGIAGDMFLGALLDAGVPLSVLENATAALGIGASLRTERVDRSGISSTKVHVLEHGTPADTPQEACRPTLTGPLEQAERESAPWSPQPQTQHKHNGGHAHTHKAASLETYAHDLHEPSSPDHAQQASTPYEHGHGRSLSAIRSLIQDAPLAAGVKAMAVRTFELLGASEARIHNVPVEQIHFHEVGAVDAIVDIVASCAGVHHLQVGAWYSSALNTGSGMVRCAHGNFPVPAPATADLLRGVPTYAAHLQKELVTPTGAALVRALQPRFGDQPCMQVEHIGYGAGSRNPANFPNVLRLSVGKLAETAIANNQQPGPASRVEGSALQTITVLETALDDASPQVLAFAAEQALALGALDVMLTPVLMKKGRPGTLFTVLCQPQDRQQMAALLLRETPTLGVRYREEQRLCLERRHIKVQTEFGPIRIKLAFLDGSLRNAAPEFEDCKAAALAADVAVKQVQTAAMAAYTQSNQL